MLDGKLQSCKINIKNPNDKNYYNPIYSINKINFYPLIIIEFGNTGKIMDILLIIMKNLILVGR